MNNIEQFIGAIESLNSQKVAKFVLKNVSDNIENYNPMELEQFVLDRKPSSPKEIITIVYVLSSYAKWLKENNIINNDNFYQIMYTFQFYMSYILMNTFVMFLILNFCKCRKIYSVNFTLCLY